jgi:serine/threonine-protein kinase RsbW
MELRMEQSALFCLKMPARYRNLELISQCIDLLLIELPDRVGQEQVIYGIKLAVHEVANNVIRHAYSHEQGILEIALQFEQSRKRFTATLYDTGAAFDTAQALAPNLDVPQESGYGLFLAEQLMDEVNYQRQPDGNQWRLVKHLL